MNRKVVQRSPDVGIGIKMKRMTPVAEVSAPPTPEPSSDLFIVVSDGTAFSIAEPFVVHTITQSLFDVEKNYFWNMIDITAQFGVDYGNATNADVTNGVTCEGGILTVPAGVTSFTLSIPIFGNPTGAIVSYQVRIGIELGGVQGLSCGDGYIFDI